MREFHADSGWSYETFDRNEPASSFGPFQNVAELWNARRVGDAFPAWSDFGFGDFVGWHGHLSVGEVNSATGDVRFRLWGTALVDLFGCEMTGKRMSDAEPGFFEDYDFRHIAEIVDQGTIMTSTGPFYWQDRDHVTVHTIKLPLAENGKDIDKILWAVRQTAQPA